VAAERTGVDFFLIPSGKLDQLARRFYRTDSVTVTAQGGLYTNSVALSCTGLPANTCVQLSPAAIQSGFSTITSTMTIASQSLAVGGTYSIATTGGTSFGRSNVSQFQLRS